MIAFGIDPGIRGFNSLCVTEVLKIARHTPFKADTFLRRMAGAGLEVVPYRESSAIQTKASCLFISTLPKKLHEINSVSFGILVTYGSGIFNISY